MTGCYAKTRKPVTFVCPEPALKLLNLRLEVKKHTRVDFSIQLHSVAGGRSRESKGLGLISDDDDSENKLLQHHWIATTVAFIIIIFIIIIILIILFCWPSFDRSLQLSMFLELYRLGGGELGRPNPPPPLPLLLLSLFSGWSPPSD